MTISMTTSTSHDRKQNKVSIAGTMTIYDAADHKKELLNAFNTSDELEIDLSGVSEMDTAGVQLLVLLKREAFKDGKQVRLVAHSAASLEVLEIYNLGAYFGDQLVISSRPKRERRRRS